MTVVGIGANGKILVGWNATVDRIGRILTTELGSRVQRRGLGCLIPRIIDRPQNPETLINFYMATAEALRPRLKRGRWEGEPCFELGRCSIAAHVPGDVILALTGRELPRGYLGDFTTSTPREITYSITRLTDEISFKAVG